MDVSGLRGLASRARETFGTLSSEKFNQQPVAGSWSVGQCLDHLNVSNRQYAEAIDNGIAQGRKKGLLSTGPFRLGIPERIFVWMLEPPSRVKVKAPDKFQPVQKPLVPEDVFREWEAIHRRLLELAESTEGLDLNKLKIASPAAPVSFSLLGSFAIICAHDRRHLWQAERVVTLVAR